MRRHESEDHEVRMEPPPFRVLSGTTSFLSPTSPPQLSPPPPSRAPDPYRIAPAAPIYGRAHRKSSFVILAEAGPNSREPSPPSLTSGRASPFRGRGFKGRPPHAQSRPETPNNERAKRRSRSDNRMSVSQQNSPKRSLIPKPISRSRSISLSKSKEKPASPKLNRRVPLRNNVKHNNALNQARKPSLKQPGLSPIKGTPTKESSAKSPNRTKSPVQISKSLKPPSMKNASKKINDIKSSTEKIVDKGNDKNGEQVNGSPSKIPLRRGSISGSVGFIKPPTSVNKNGPVSKTTKSKSDKLEVKKKSEIQKTGNETKEQTDGSKDKIDEAKKKETSVKKKEKMPKEELSKTQSGKVDESAIELTELVKQSSNATGTHIVVNKTTTTAVQPLQIDVAEKKESEKEKEDPDKQKIQSTVEPVKKTSEQKVEVVNALSTSDIQVNQRKETSVKAAEKPVPVESVKMALPEPTASSNEIKQLVTLPTEETKVEEKLEETSSKKLPEKQSMEDKKEKVDVEVIKSSSVAKMEKLEIMEIVEEGESKNVEKLPVVDPVNIKPQSSTQGLDKAPEQGSTVSLKSERSSHSIGSVRSTDTGVSLNTVHGVSSAREKMDTHLVKNSSEIETLSGNVVHSESNGEPTTVPTVIEEQQQTARQKFLSRWKKTFGNYCKCCPGSMRCLACRRDPKGLLWPKNEARKISRPVPEATVTNEDKPPGRWSRFKKACRCSRLRETRLCVKRARVAPAEKVNCCPPERRFGALCRRLFANCACKSCSCNCCKRSDAQRTRSVRAKHSLTSVAAPPLSEEQRPKIPDVLVEHNSLMRGAIPCLPLPLAWFCLIWNVLLPGSGTFWSGIFNLCTGQPRFSAVAGPKARFGAFIVNLIVGIGQLFTVLFCLVGWGWSIWWGITMIRLAKKYKRFKDSEAANHDPEAGRGADGAAISPGVPSQALRGIERAR